MPTKKLSDLKQTLFLENSMYATPQEKEALLADEGRLATLLAVNFFGMLGVLNATDDSKKINIQQHFRRDGQVRLRAIGDRNLDISLIVKLAAEARMFVNPAIVNEITKFLFLLKSGKIRDVDSRIVGSWASNLKPSVINKISNPFVKRAFKQFIADEGMTIDVSEFAMSIRRRVKDVEGIEEFSRFALRGNLKAKTNAMKPDDADDSATAQQVPTHPASKPQSTGGQTVPQKPKDQTTADKVALSDTSTVDATKAKKEEEPKQKPFDLDTNEYARLFLGVLMYPRMVEDATESIDSAIQVDGMAPFKAGILVGEMERALRSKDRKEWDRIVSEYPRYAPPFEVVALQAIKEVYNKKSTPIDSLILLGEAVFMMTTNADVGQLYAMVVLDKLALNSDWWSVREKVMPLLKHLPSDALDRVLNKQIGRLNATAYAANRRSTQNNVLTFLRDLSKEKPEYQYDLVKMFIIGDTSTLFGFDDLYSGYSLQSFFKLIGENYADKTYIYDQVRDYIVDHVSGLNGYKFTKTVSGFYMNYSQNFSFNDVKIDKEIRLKFREVFDGILAEIENNSLTDESKYILRKFVDVNVYEFYEKLLGYLPDTVEKLIYHGKTSGSSRYGVDYLKGQAAYVTERYKTQRIFDPERHLTKEEFREELTEMFDENPEAIGSSVNFFGLSIIQDLVRERPEFRAEYLLEVAKATAKYKDSDYVKKQAGMATGSGYYWTGGSDNIGKLIIQYGCADDMDREQATEFLKYVTTGNITSLSSEAIKSIRRREQKRSMKNTVASIVFSAIQTDEGSEIASDYLDTLDTYMQNNIRSALIGSSTASLELLQGDVGTGKRLDSSKLRGALLINDVDISEVGDNFPRKKKNENLVDYIKRATENVPQILPSPPVEVKPEENTKEHMLRKTFEMNTKYYAGKHTRSRIKVIKVYTGNQAMTQEFIEFRKRFENDDNLPTQTVIPAFHGTAMEVGAFVARFGFKVIADRPGTVVVSGRMLGDGIYFTNKIDKACQYLKNDARGGYSKAPGLRGYVFELDNTLGRVPTNSDYAGVWDKSYGVRSPEWVVRDPQKQLHVLKIYEIVTVTEQEYRRDIKPLQEEIGMVSFSDYLKEERMSEQNHSWITFSFVDKVVPVVRKDGGIDLIEVWDEDGRKAAEKALPKYAVLDVQGNAVHVKFPYKEDGGYMTMFARSMPKDMYNHYVQKWRNG